MLIIFGKGSVHELFGVQNILFQNHPPLPQKSSGTLLRKINYINYPIIWPNLAPMLYLALSQHSINSHYLLAYQIIDCYRRISMLVISDVSFLGQEGLC